MNDITRQRIINIISNETGAGHALIADNNSFETLGLDSLDIVCIAAEIEDEMDICLPRNAEAAWTCLEDVLASLEGELA